MFPLPLPFGPDEEPYMLFCLDGPAANSKTKHISILQSTMTTDDENFNEKIEKNEKK